MEDFQLSDACSSDVHMQLKNFLNQECMWVKNDAASTSYVKVFNCTTSVSPKFLPISAANVDALNHFINVTLLMLKLKTGMVHLTVYINDRVAACCTATSVHVRHVHWNNMVLIYFGNFLPLPDPVDVPANPAPAIKECNSLTKSDIWETSDVVSSLILKDNAGAPEYQLVGRCVWITPTNIYMFFLSPDFMHCCPSLDAFPSLGCIINRLTRCEDSECVACYGSRIHVCVARGHTLPEDPGNSSTCPCVLSCNALQYGYAPITGHRNLLSLLFDAQIHMTIKGLKFFLTNNPTDSVKNIFCGVTYSGEYVHCKSEMWTLLKISQFFSRYLIYECQILKRSVLHSC